MSLWCHVCVCLLWDCCVLTPGLPACLPVDANTVPEFDSTTMEFLQHLARRFGKMKKVGIPNIEDAAKIVLRGW